MNVRSCDVFFPFVLRLAAILLVASHVAIVRAESSVDRFDDDRNPNGWSWASNFGPISMVTPDGGNPGGWNDTGIDFFARNPEIGTIPPAGSPLRAVLSSGTLHGASIDVIRLDTTDVENCNPTRLTSSFVVLELFDEHTSEFGITARTIDGPFYPAGFFPWFSTSFAIPPPSTETPPGWELIVPDGVQYTWSDLLQNIDGVQFDIGDPLRTTFNACWHLGVDNITFTDGESVFADGFDPPRT